MTRKTVLVVDDERDLVDILQFNLVREQYRVLTAFDGETALEIAEREGPDLVILDLMLPGIGGLEVCRRLRAGGRTAHIPVMMLTAKGEETDAVIGLAQGADDYVRKPFGVRELMARVAAQLRRGRGPSGGDLPQVVRWRELVIDSDRFEATLGGDTLALTATELRLLRHLAARPGRAFTRADLLDAVHGMEAFVVDRTIDVHVAAVRRKLGSYGKFLETVRGIGYRFADA